MASPIGLALSLALLAQSPTLSVRLRSHVATVEDARFEARSGGGGALWGWFCRHAAGDTAGALHVSAFDAEGRLLWERSISTPHLDPGRVRQCRALKADFDAEALDRVSRLNVD